MDKQQVKELALDSGFKLKEQSAGGLDLNSYVYEFAAALLEPLEAAIEELGQSNRVLKCDLAIEQLTSTRQAARLAEIEVAVSRQYPPESFCVGDWVRGVKEAVRQSPAVSVTNIECRGLERFMELFAATSASDEVLTSEVVVDMLGGFIKREKAHDKGSYMTQCLDVSADRYEVELESLAKVIVGDPPIPVDVSKIRLSMHDPVPPRKTEAWQGSGKRRMPRQRG